MDEKQLRQEFAKRDIRRIKVGGFDVDGILRGKYISFDKFWSATKKGFGFCDVIFGWDVADALYDNATLTGWHSGYPDALAKLDLDSFRVLPSEPNTAHFLADFWEDHETPHRACPRNLLKGVTEQLREAGYTAKVGVELEYWIFKEDPHSLQEKGFSNLTPLSPGMYGYSWVREGQHAELLEGLLDELGAYDIEMESMHTETGPGVYETAIRYNDPVKAADMAALFKTTMKILCARRGYMVTFMAKWNPDLPGSSGHIHQSLCSLDGEENLFGDADGPDGLSELARHYVGGLIELSPDLTALISPTINSYKRYVPGMWAPMSATWGVENRTCSVRVINQPSPKSTRVEFRQGAADINPYIAISACLAAGFYGVQNRIAPPPPSSGDATAVEGKALPTSLADAVRTLRESKKARQVLPAAFVDHYIASREWEVREYAKSVSDWELRRYFESI